MDSIILAASKKNSKSLISSIHDVETSTLVVRKNVSTHRVVFNNRNMYVSNRKQYNREHGEQKKKQN